MSRKKLLIIEDEKAVAKQLKWGLSDFYDITIAHDAEVAQQLLTTNNFPVVTLDLGLPPHPDSPKEGLKLLKEISRMSSFSKVIVITGSDDPGIARQAIALGAVDFCSKPINLEHLKIILERAFYIYELESAYRSRDLVQETACFHGMIGVSDAMQDIFKTIARIARTDYPVLIVGESGTGKELAAKAIHLESNRKNERFVVVNCGSIPENLIESELFGYEKGAFTGATRTKIGKFEYADRGTVFLDEIGELPLAMQVKLLRVLQEKTIERIGAVKPRKIDVRIVAATNVDLQKAVDDGNFREDLFFRLNVLTLNMPPLRERGEDILILAQHFIRKEASTLGKGRITLSPKAAAAIMSHTWPGNVRELQNAIKRAVAMCISNTIYPEDLHLSGHNKNLEIKTQHTPTNIPTLKEARYKAEKKAVLQALGATGNNITHAAKLLGISRPTLHELIKKHKLSV